MLKHDSDEDVTVLHAELIDKEFIQVQVQVNNKVGTVWLRKKLFVMNLNL